MYIESIKCVTDRGLPIFLSCLCLLNHFTDQYRSIACEIFILLLSIYAP